MTATETTENPSQPIIEANANRQRILTDLQNHALTDGDRQKLHDELRASEDAYTEAVNKLGKRQAASK